MKLSTSTNIVSERLGRPNLSLEKTLRLASQAGFQRFDLNFYDWIRPDSPFCSEGWERWTFEAIEIAAELQVEFGQCHAHTYSFLDPAISEEERAHQEMLVRRSLKCCSLLGSGVCVLHPDTSRDPDRPAKQSKADNLEYFKRLMDEAARLNLELALENMCDYSIAPKRKFFVTPEEIVDFVDAFGDDRLGVCWDFEHGDIQEIDQPAALRLFGPRLKATHVSDTVSKTYEPLMHIMPFFGFTDWPAIMPVLREIGYKGDFSFEAHNFAKRLPDGLLPQALRFSYEIGRYLMTL